MTARLAPCDRFGVPLGRKSSAVEVEGRACFLNVHLPPPRIVVIGAVQYQPGFGADGRALPGSTSASSIRAPAFATPERFDGVDLVADWPVDVLKEQAS